MLHSEVEVILDDLRRATTRSWKGSTVETVFELVLDDIARIIERIEKSNKGQVYKTIYGRKRG